MPAHPIRLYDTRTRSIQPVQPVEPDKLKLYLCGMTVYDHCHVGHARAMMVYDALVRYLRHRGWTVRFARNITDIDDKIIAKAQAEGIEPLELAQRYIDSFHQDMEALGTLAPDHEPRVSQTLDGICDMVSTLIEKGHAYVAEGTVWFDVRSDPDYGCLSGRKLDGLQSADPEGGKRFSADFALWKAAKEGEPSWPSPWGPGRPGWHIECSAMAVGSLGETLDIHGGGLDLVFPHHENEIAQSECATGHRFANIWMHNGLLTVGSGAKGGGRSHRASEGDAASQDDDQVESKMGKSKGNAFIIRNALELVPAEAIRLYYLQTHYRSPLPWSDEALLDSLAMLARLYEAREQALSWGGEEDPDQVARSLGADALKVLQLGRTFRDRFYEALDEDFNTSAALGLAFELARAINRLGNHKKARKRAGPVVGAAIGALTLLPETLGLLTLTGEAFQEEVRTKRLRAMGVARERVEELLDARQAARADKDWARADSLRDQLDDLGVIVMDTPTGPTWKVRLAEPADDAQD